MPQSVERWWSRRQWASGATVPYPIGAYRKAWVPYPRLVEQFHPDRNHELLLSQIPPGADVYLLWVCGIGHDFVATPSEQRSRPGRSRSARSWCPVCAAPSLLPSVSKWPRGPVLAAPRDPAAGLHNSGVLDGGAHPRRLLRRVEPPQRPLSPELWRTAAQVEPGGAFVSEAASRATSAAEGRLRALIGERLDVDLSATAVRVRTPFFGRLEVWPDVIVPELALAIELDTVGRNADEHIGRREQADRRKDRLLREVGWQVIRLRCRPLRPLGPHDLVVAGVSAAAVEALLDRMGVVRGELFVQAYARNANDANDANDASNTGVAR